jgi:hypothetical protein
VVTAVARTYRQFARLEARGRSAAYEALAESVAGDTALVSFIASLPPEKRQPNLLFAAARYLLGAAWTPTAGIAMADSHGTFLRWLA